MQIEIFVYHVDSSALLLEQLIERIDKMTDTSDRLSREVGETRDAVTALTGRYQTKIDALQVEIDRLNAALANGDTAAAQAAADALDQLQTELAGLEQAPAPTEPAPSEEPAPSA